MADNTELKHMVMSFRVSELQVLLGFAGRNKTGRKQELLTRALNLVQKGCSMPVQIKIRDLYRKINDQLFLSARRRFPAGKSPSDPASGGPMLDHSQPESTQGKQISPVNGGTDKGLRSAPPVTKSTGAPMDYTKLAPPPTQTSNGLPVHPDVRLRVLPFYDIKGELLKPSSLVPRGTVRFQESYFVFHLTPQQAQDIAMSRDFRPGVRAEYLVQVQLRFCLCETSCEQDDNFPPSICVRVNGKMAPLPNPIPSTKPGVEPRRPSRPVDITPLCRLSPTSSNHIDVSWASEFGRGYCVAVYLVKKLSSDILFSRLKQSGLRHPDHSRALIKEKLSHDPDSEIATTSLRVSLCCPLGKMRMQNPSRASSCSHLQCFDASTFLMMNEKKPTWTCPVCDKPAPFDKMILDGLFVEILQQASGCNEIQFMEDGSWKPMIPNKETLVIASPIVDVNPGSSSSSKKPQPEVIDLTSDTSDDDDDDDLITDAARPGSLTIEGSPSPASSTASSSSDTIPAVSPPILSGFSPEPISPPPTVIQPFPSTSRISPDVLSSDSVLNSLSALADMISPVISNRAGITGSSSMPMSSAPPVMTAAPPGLYPVGPPVPVFNRGHMMSPMPTTFPPLPSFYGGYDLDLMSLLNSDSRGSDHELSDLITLPQSMTSQSSSSQSPPLIAFSYKTSPDTPPDVISLD